MVSLRNVSCFLTLVYCTTDNNASYREKTYALQFSAFNVSASKVLGTINTLPEKQSILEAIEHLFAKYLEIRPLFLVPARPINDEWNIRPYFGVLPFFFRALQRARKLQSYLQQICFFFLAIHLCSLASLLVLTNVFESFCSIHKKYNVLFKS